jgi:hypothetical protein
MSKNKDKVKEEKIFLIKEDNSGKLFSGTVYRISLNPAIQTMWDKMGKGKKKKKHKR